MEVKLITVSDIISLPAFKEIELAVPCADAAMRPTWNIGILDSPAAVNGYAEFSAGEFIVSSMGFANNDIEMIEETVGTLLPRKVAAFAVNADSVPEVTARMEEAVKKTGVPLYIYRGDYIEIIAYQALDLMRRDEIQSDKRRLVDSLLSDHDSDMVRDVIYQLSGATGATIQCISVSPSAVDEMSLYALLGTVNDILARFKLDYSSVEVATACRYKDMLLAFVSYSEPSATIRSRSEADLAIRLSQIANVRLGIGEECPLPDGDLSVREAIASMTTSRTEGDAQVAWNELHYDAFRAAARSDRLYRRISTYNKTLLEEYDTEYNSQLQETCLALARAYGDIRQTAEKLNLHPNTVRYRLRKAKQVLGMADSADNEFAFFLGQVYLESTNPFIE